MKKISLLKILSVMGAVTLTSVCVVETTLLLHKNDGVSPQDAELIDLAQYNTYTLATPLETLSTPDADTFKVMLRNGIKNGPSGEVITPISDILDIDVTVHGESHQFLVTAKNNSAIYKQGSSALISYALPVPVALTSITGTATPNAYIEDKYEQEFTKANLLKSLASQYPGLNINHLDIAFEDGYKTQGTAIITAKPNSTLYSDANALTATYYTSASVTMTANTYVISSGTSATVTFSYRGTNNPSGVTYSSTALPSGIITLSGGVLSYAGGNVGDFNGGAYEITGSYTTGGNTYIAKCVIFAQPNTQTGTLSINTPNININSLSTVSSTMTVNGVTVSGSSLSYSISPSLPTGHGLAFSTTTGVLTWDKKATTGGVYVIKGTYATGKTATATALVTVADARDAVLTVASKNIDSTTKTSGTATFTVNGVAKTPTWTISPAAPSIEGLTFANGVLTWNGTSVTSGGFYTIGATFTESTSNITLTREVTVFVKPYTTKPIVNGNVPVPTNFSTTGVQYSYDPNSQVLTLFYTQFGGMSGTKQWTVYGITGQASAYGYTGYNVTSAGRYLNGSEYMRRMDVAQTGVFTPYLGSDQPGQYGLTLHRVSIGTTAQYAPEKLKLTVTYNDIYLCNQITTILGVSSISDGLYIAQGE